MKSYNILFIGNSYTYFNTMPEELFAPIADSAGYDVNVKSITRGDWELIRFADSEDEFGKMVDDALRTEKFDFVVMQEQSTNPVLNRGRFYTGARALLKKVRENGATPLLYCTWARMTGSEVLTENGLTNEAMTWMIAAAYEAIGAEQSIDVAHVGKAFFDAFSDGREKAELYNSDLSHPSYSGSFLAALTIFSRITGEAPESVSFKGSLSEEMIAILRRAVRKAVFEPVGIPEEYLTSSEGI